MTCFILSHKPKESPSNLVSPYGYKRTFSACMISKRRAWWDRWVSNPRHLDFQSNALPSGLPSHIPLLVRAATLFPVCLYTRTASMWRIFRVLVLASLQAKEGSSPYYYVSSSQCPTKALLYYLANPIFIYRFKGMILTMEAVGQL